jgi:hypothetical protein
VNNPYSLEGPVTAIVAGLSSRPVEDPSMCPITGQPMGARRNPYRQRLVTYIQNYKSTLSMICPQESENISESAEREASEASSSCNAPSTRRGSVELASILETPWPDPRHVSKPEATQTSPTPSSSDEGSTWDGEDVVASAARRRRSPQASRSSRRSLPHATALSRPHSI